jgi:hypothetical protein
LLHHSVSVSTFDWHEKTSGFDSMIVGVRRAHLRGKSLTATENYCVNAVAAPVFLTRKLIFGKNFDRASQTVY